MERMTPVAVALFMLSCGGAQQPEKKFTGAGQGTGAGMCEVVRAGAHLVVEDGYDTIDIVVHGPPEKRERIQTFLREMAAMHEDRRLGYEGSVAHREALPEHATSVVYTANGARVSYRPLDPAERSALFHGLQEHVTQLPGRCGLEQR